MSYLVISTKQANEIIFARAEDFDISLDLGMTKTRIKKKEGMVIIGEQKIPLADFEKLKDHFLYVIEENQLKKIAVFSDETNLYYKLIPTSDWPTFGLSSTPMHRHTHISPKQDTQTKIDEIKPVVGKVLDTCCGSGYTAIMAAKEAEEVHTFERDKNVLFLDEINPYSREVFTNPKITLHREDVTEGIKKFGKQHFKRIIHDPPTVKRSPELYSRDFYSELYRVLDHGGILYHYSPLPGKTKGEQFNLTIAKKLKEAGFENVQFHEKSSGIRAIKPQIKIR